MDFPKVLRPEGLRLGAGVLDNIESAEGRTSKKPPQRGRRPMLCMAHYFIGQMHLLRNETEAAAESFRKAIATEARDTLQYTGARTELQRLRTGKAVAEPQEPKPP